MTVQERIDAFVEEYIELSRKYNVVIFADAPQPYNTLVIERIAPTLLEDCPAGIRHSDMTEQEMANRMENYYDAVRYAGDLTKAEYIIHDID